MQSMGTRQRPFSAKTGDVSRVHHYNESSNRPNRAKMSITSSVEKPLYKTNESFEQIAARKKFLEIQRPYFMQNNYVENKNEFCKRNNTTFIYNAISKEDLYIQLIQTKKKLNELQSRNMKIKTQISQKKKEELESLKKFQENRKRPQSSKGSENIIKSSQAILKIFDQGQQIINGLKTKIKTVRDQIQEKQNEFNQLKLLIKHTDMREFEQNKNLLTQHTTMLKHQLERQLMRHQLKEFQANNNNNLDQVFDNKIQKLTQQNNNLLQQLKHIEEDHQQYQQIHNEKKKEEDNLKRSQSEKIQIIQDLKASLKIIQDKVQSYQKNSKFLAEQQSLAKEKEKNINEKAKIQAKFEQLDKDIADKKLLLQKREVELSQIETDLQQKIQSMKDTLSEQKQKNQTLQNKIEGKPSLKQLAVQTTQNMLQEIRQRTLSQDQNSTRNRTQSGNQQQQQDLNSEQGQNSQKKLNIQKNNKDIEFQKQSTIHEKKEDEEQSPMRPSQQKQMSLTKISQDKEYHLQMIKTEKIYNIEKMQTNNQQSNEQVISNSQDQQINMQVQISSVDQNILDNKSSPQNQPQQEITRSPQESIKNPKKSDIQEKKLNNNQDSIKPTNLSQEKNQNFTSSSQLDITAEQINYCQQLIGGQKKKILEDTQIQQQIFEFIQGISTEFNYQQEIKKLVNLLSQKQATQYPSNLQQQPTLSLSKQESLFFQDLLSFNLKDFKFQQKIKDRQTLSATLLKQILQHQNIINDINEEILESYDCCDDCQIDEIVSGRNNHFKGSVEEYIAQIENLDSLLLNKLFIQQLGSDQLEFTNNITITNSSPTEFLIQCKLKETKQMLSVKVSELTNYNQIEQYQKEMYLSQTVGNPHICTPLFSFLEFDKYSNKYLSYRGFEPVKCDLKTYIQSINLSLSEKLTLALQVSFGLWGMHSAELIFINLDPSRVWVDIDGQANVSDLGKCYQIHQEIDEEQKTFKKILEFNQQDLKTSGQSEKALIYVAPEILSGRTFDQRADTYSLGKICQLIFTKDDASKVCNNISRHLLPDELKNVQESILKQIQFVINKCLTENYKQRLFTANACLLLQSILAQAYPQQFQILFQNSDFFKPLPIAKQDNEIQNGYSAGHFYYNGGMYFGQKSQGMPNGNGILFSYDTIFKQDEEQQNQISLRCLAGIFKDGQIDKNEYLEFNNLDSTIRYYKEQQLFEIIENFDDNSLDQQNSSSDNINNTQIRKCHIVQEQCCSCGNELPENSLKQILNKKGIMFDFQGNVMFGQYHENGLLNGVGFKLIKKQKQIYLGNFKNNKYFSSGIEYCFPRILFSNCFDQIQDCSIGLLQTPDELQMGTYLYSSDIKYGLYFSVIMSEEQEQEEEQKHQQEKQQYLHKITNQADNYLLEFIKQSNNWIMILQNIQQPQIKPITVELSSSLKLNQTQLETDILQITDIYDQEKGNFGVWIDSQEKKAMLGYFQSQQSENQQAQQIISIGYQITVQNIEKITNYALDQYAINDQNEEEIQEESMNQENQQQQLQQQKQQEESVEF